jgi:hypothetical protein
MPRPNEGLCQPSPDLAYVSVGIGFIITLTTPITIVDPNLIITLMFDPPVDSDWFSTTLGSAIRY